MFHTCPPNTSPQSYAYTAARTLLSVGDLKCLSKIISTLGDFLITEKNLRPPSPVMHDSTIIFPPHFKKLVLPLWISLYLQLHIVNFTGTVIFLSDSPNHQSSTCKMFVYQQFSTRFNTVCHGV